MTFVDLLWLPPLMFAIACVVGGVGRPRGEVWPHVRSAFVTLTLAVVVVGLIVRLIVALLV